MRFHQQNVQRMVCEVSLIVAVYLLEDLLPILHSIVTLDHKLQKHRTTCCTMALLRLSRFVVQGDLWFFRIYSRWCVTDVANTVLDMFVALPLGL